MTVVAGLMLSGTSCDPDDCCFPTVIALSDAGVTVGGVNGDISTPDITVNCPMAWTVQDVPTGLVAVISGSTLTFKATADYFDPARTVKVTLLAANGDKAKVTIKQNTYIAVPNTDWYYAGEPFTLTTAHELAGLAQLVNDGTGGFTSSKTITLGNNIDLSHFGYGAAFNDGKGWIPIGKSGKVFSGIFDGNGHTVSGLYINDPTLDDVGLFGSGSSYNIKNLGVEIAPEGITGHDYVGGIMGWGGTGSPIQDCFVTGGPITGHDRVGGVAGLHTAKISNCYVTCAVIGNDYTGGIVGEVSSFAPEHCVALNQSITAIGLNDARIVGFSSVLPDNNYAGDWLPVKGPKGVNEKEGEDVSLANAKTQSFYEALTWDFTNIWDMGADGYPKLR